MGMLTFNAENGFLEAIVRGYRLGLISTHQYNNFCQSETLEDLKVQLNATEYGDLIQTLPTNITTSVIGETLRRKFVEEFRYLQSHAVGDLARFLEYITYEYQIDNVVFIITAMLHESSSAEELLARCHPLGVFDGLTALTVARSVEELYNTVLVETPLAPYFRECMSSKDLNDFNVEVIRNTLHRAYLEDFYKFCTVRCDSATGEMMGMVLSFEADRRILNISINTLGSEMAREDRIKLFPRFGRLYESGVAKKLAYAEDILQVKSIIDAECPEYRQLLEVAVLERGDSDKAPEPSGTRSLEEYFFEKEVSFCKDLMLHQFSFCPFYGFVKLKEQELRNIVWIAECIAQNQKENIHHFIPLY